MKRVYQEPQTKTYELEAAISMMVVSPGPPTNDFDSKGRGYDVPSSNYSSR